MEWERSERSERSDTEGLLTQEEFDDLWMDIERTILGKRPRPTPRSASKRPRWEPWLPSPPPEPSNYGYLATLPPELIREALLRMDPVAAQKLCMHPDFARRCSGDFWNEKVGIPRAKLERGPPEVRDLPQPPLTLDEYGKILIDRGTCAYGPISFHSKGKWCILDALDKRDLDRFRYYVQHIDIDPSTNYGRMIQWFAYFAGPEFGQLYPPVPLTWLQISAFQGNVDAFIDTIQRYPVLSEFVADYITLAVIGGSVRILQFLFEDPGIIGENVRNVYYYGGKLHELIQQAQYDKHPEVERYLRTLVRPGVRSNKTPVVYLTRPLFYRGKYEWIISRFAS